MTKIVINGQKKLNGTIRISGAKNSAVALIPAALLADGEVTLCNIPNITDIEALSEILVYLGAKVKNASETILIDSTNLENKIITEEQSKKLRASYYFMGALLGKYKKVAMYFPGGCSIGSRPIDLHLKGFEALGATVNIDGNKFLIEAEELKGANIYLDFASVGATINIMLAAVLAKGVTTIENAAKEPEIVNVAVFLNSLGAKIVGAGTSTIKIYGVKKLTSGFSEVIPDRIEAGTYTIIAALAGETVKIDNVIPEHIEMLIAKLVESGVNIFVGTDYLIINGNNNLKSVSIKTLTYPGFPTDLQQPFTTFLTQTKGTSIVEETIYENRFMNVSYLNKMGANIEINKKEASINGPTKLIGKEVTATDLRAGASLVVAGLIAEGTTIIHESEHILRGYENIIDKLTELGADITLIK